MPISVYEPDFYSEFDSLDGSFITYDDVPDWQLAEQNMDIGEVRWYYFPKTVDLRKTDIDFKISIYIRAKRTVGIEQLVGIPYEDFRAYFYFLQHGTELARWCVAATSIEPCKKWVSEQLHAQGIGLISSLTSGTISDIRNRS